MWSLSISLSLFGSFAGSLNSRAFLFSLCSHLFPSSIFSFVFVQSFPLSFLFPLRCVSSPSPPLQLPPPLPRFLLFFSVAFSHLLCLPQNANEPFKEDEQFRSSPLHLYFFFFHLSLFTTISLFSPFITFLLPPSPIPSAFYEHNREQASPSLSHSFFLFFTFSRSFL